MGQQSATVTLFGSPALTVAGEQVGLSRKKGIAIIGYLSIEDRPVARDTLCGLLWGESSQADARRSLRTTLADLRSALPDGTICVANENLEMAIPDGFSIDVREYLSGRLSIDKEVWRAGREPSAQEADRMREIAGLYTADFMSGFFLSHCPDFDDWQGETRERLRRLQMDLLWMLARSDIAADRLTDATGWLRDLLAFDSTDEEIHRDLMLLYARQGDRTAALHQYERCRDVLQREDGQDPHDETTDLYHRIRCEVASGTSDSPGRLDIGLEIDAGTVRGPPRQNLPAPVSSFVGRRRVLAEIATLMAERLNRIITIVGPPGVGKTTTALRSVLYHLESADDRAVWVELAPVEPGRDAYAQVIWAVATASGVRLPSSDSAAVMDAVTSVLGQRRTVLVLDNCEHLLDEAARFVGTLVRKCPYLVVVASSRERLRVTGETVISLDPLSVPPGDEESLLRASEYEAVELFVERGRTASRSFVLNEDNLADVVTICRRLDGIALAIELAAARLTALSVREVASGLDHRMGLLTTGGRDAPARLQTLRASLEWSYDLLDRDGQSLLDRLSVFRGGCQIDQALGVCADDDWSRERGIEVVSSLIEKSLVRRTDMPCGGIRLEVLESVAELGREHLEQRGELEAVCRRHAETYRLLAEEGGAALCTGNDVEWMDRYTPDLANFRTAIRAYFDRRDAEAVIRVVRSLRIYFMHLSHLDDLTYHVREAINMLSPDQEVVRGLGLAILSQAAFMVRDMALLREYGAELVSLGTRHANASLLIQGYWCGFHVNQFAGDHLAARTAGRLCIALDGDIIDYDRQHNVEMWLTSYAPVGERKASLGRMLDRARTENFEHRVASVLTALALVEFGCGNFAATDRVLLESVESWQRCHNYAMASTRLEWLGRRRVEMGDYAGAAERFGQGIELARQVGYKPFVDHYIIDDAAMSFHMGDLGRTEENIARWRREAGDDELPEFLLIAARLAHAYGDLHRATQLLETAASKLPSDRWTEMAATVGAFAAVVGHDSGRPGVNIESLRNVVDLRPLSNSTEFSWIRVVEGLDWLAVILADSAQWSRGARCVAAGRALRSFTGLAVPAPYRERWESTRRLIESQVDPATVEEQCSGLTALDPEDRSEAYRALLREL